MTDKEKLEKVKAEIERLKEIAEYNLSHSKMDRSAWMQQAAVCAKLLSFIDSMQKEPKQCMYSTSNYTNADRLTLCKDCEELCKYNQKTAAESLGIPQEAYDEIVDKCLYGSEVELVDDGDLPREEPISEYDNAKTYIKGLIRDTIKTCIFHKEENPSENAVEYIAATILKLVKKDINYKKEEPVSEDLEKEFARIWDKDLSGKIDSEAALNIARHFAAWQKEQMMAKAVEIARSEIYEWLLKNAHTYASGDGLYTHSMINDLKQAMKDE